jgi:hypothetical protein
MIALRSRFETFDRLRLRVLRETEQALLYGLEHPDTITDIPVVEAGTAAFSPAYATQFWAQVLGVGAS